MEFFDKSISTTIASILDIQQPTEQELLQISIVRGLPEELGGWNMPCHASPLTDIGIINSRERFREYVEEHTPTLPLPQFDPTKLETFRLEYQQRAQVPDYVDLSSLKSTALSLFSKIQEDFLTELTSKRKMFEKMWLIENSFPHSFRWFKWNGGYSGRHIWSNAPLQAALRARLLLPLPGFARRETELICPCNTKVNLISNPFHCLDCNVNPGFWIDRHNWIRYVFKEFVHSKRPLGCHTEKEVLAPGTNRKADLRIRIESKPTAYLDFAIVNPCASSHINRNGLEARRKNKEYRYRSITDGRFVPFVVSTTGKLDEVAHKYANSFFYRDNTKTKSKFLKSKSYMEMLTIIATYTGQLLRSTFNRASRPRARAPPARARA